MFGKKYFYLMLLLTLLVGMVNIPTTTAQEAGIAGEPVALAGLDGEVTVKYDTFDIPHIYATTSHDLFMVQGYLTAQNRWWQMEWSRRQASGRLAEVMGDTLIGTDIFLRTAGLRRNAERDLANLPQESVDFLQAYADGVNLWIDGKEPTDIAVEYRFLGWMGAELEVEPWTPLDSLAFSQAMAFLFERDNIEDELFKAGLIEQGGPLAPFLLMPAYDYENAPLISEPGVIAGSTADTAALPTGVEVASLDALPPMNFDTFELPLLVEGDFGSNSWAVSGKLTDTGMPYLANDPHIGQNNPSVWYEVGLHCVEVSEACPYDAYGYSLPGLPAFLIGHNRNIAWGMTVNGVDTIDTFTLELNPDNPLQYKFEGEWVDMEIIYEDIDVARAQPVRTPILITHFGPIINQLLGIDTPTAMRATQADPNSALTAFFDLLKASDWDEFQAAIAQFDLAGQNFAYADVDGNIGVVAGGRIPIRVAGDDGTLPKNGTDDSMNWQGYLDPMQNPRIFNPESGFVVAANNAFVRPDELPTTMGVYYSYGQRAARVQELLMQADVVTIDTMSDIQADNLNPAARFVVPVLAEIDFGDETLNNARDWLADWDLMNDLDSGQAALFNAFWMKLIPLAFDEVIEDAPSVNGGSREMFLMQNMIHGAHPLWNNPELGTNDRDEILKLALQQAWDLMVETFGDDTSTWRWGALHISHPKAIPLGQLPMGVDTALDLLAFQAADIFNRQYEATGGLESVNNNRWDVRNGNFELSGAIVSMRMVIDFSDFDNSRYIHELGQSGDPFGVHFDDMSPLWAHNQYHPAPFSADAVDALTVRTETFIPAE